jgi:serine/threonine protein kinase
MFQKHCPGCFENKQGLAACPHCGYDESAPRSQLLMPHGTILAGTYRIGRVLGRPGGFGVTYLAWDTQLQQRVAVKEYLPRDKVGRDASTLQISVHMPEQEAHFNFGLDQFLSEARMIAKFDHPNIVRVRNFFRAFGTAYLVMDYYEGRSLGDYLSQLDKPIEAAAAGQMMLSVLDGLQFVHDHGVLHRDVKPHNIYMTSTGRVILLDFGAARQAAGDNVDSISVVLSEGYAPLEQYQKNSPQGPWTDIYGVGATLYRMLKGVAPPMALDRLGADPLDADFGLPARLTAVLRKALALRPPERYATALEFKQALMAALELSDQTIAPSRAFPASPEAETKAVAWGMPVDTVHALKREADAPPPIAPAPAPIAWGPAWLIAGAIVLGALIISLPLWLRG